LTAPFLRKKVKADMATKSDQPQVIIPADWVPGPNQGNWTYNEFIALPDEGIRYEIANGVLLSMPSATGYHQDTIGEISFYLRSHVKLPGLGLVSQSPCIVELTQKDVFQPDICVVLNAHLDRVQDNRVFGAPDLVVEVTSPGTVAFERLTKYDVYEYAGVLEYWIVNLDRRTVEIFVLEGDAYYSLGVFQREQKVQSRLISWLSVRVEQFFM
jgi:Uma2 family endonuclease